MSGCKGTNTPLALGERLSKTEGFGFQDETLYRSVIGALQYATLTRPELAYGVNKLSQFMAKPLVPHWTACKRVLRYLKDTKDYGLEFTTSNNNDLVGFCDADWGCDVDDRKSISGYCIFLGGNLVSWSSKKQHVVARSSAESEYRAIALTCAEITWISSLLSELNMAIPSAPVIWSDSISAAAIASNPVLHGRTKHIEIDLHFIRDKVSAGEIEIQYISSQEQTADILTKPLSFGKFSHFRNKLKVTEKTLSLREDVEEVEPQSCDSITQPTQQHGCQQIKEDKRHACWYNKEHTLQGPCSQRTEKQSCSDGDHNMLVLN
ncbi:Retrovirus-related Pol polyprotein from transposon TNT 1-94 [Melia azedarach]|uniref:Retrovirus-related Pol polyprotein from transposon TNT 1-94 n=1 Tax=Melia azedarach TaxID=155640 RepID=A0ACC1YUZ5_MELAZ|nr:Retrovirus-related Pol polyprotein from transposon TNT 1-94 [Melia azedarach]